jgi:hypothetical protein
MKVRGKKKGPGRPPQDSEGAWSRAGSTRELLSNMLTCLMSPTTRRPAKRISHQFVASGSCAGNGANLVRAVRASSKRASARTAPRYRTAT